MLDTRPVRRWNSAGRIVAAAVAALVLGGWAVSGLLDAPAPAGPAAAHRGLVVIPPGERVAAPALSGATVDGGTVSWADYRGKVVVLNVWSSWCDPCQAEAGELQKAATKYRDRGVAFLGINRESGRREAQDFEKEFDIGYPSLQDPQGSLVLKFPAGSVTPQSIPNTLVVDRDGRLAAHALRGVGADDLDFLIRSVLGEKP